MGAVTKKEKEIVRKFLAKIGSIGGKKSKGGGRKPISDDELTERQKKQRVYQQRYRRKLAKKNKLQA